MMTRITLHQIRKQAEQKRVINCSLSTLIIVYGLAALCAFIVNKKKSKDLEALLDNSWVPFSFFFSTAVWVVLSRVVQSQTRFIIFLIWMLSIIFIVSWGALNKDYGGAMVTFATSIAISFLIIYIILRFMKVNKVFDDNLYLIVPIIVSSVVFLLAPFIPWMNANWSSPYFIVSALVSSIISIFYLWNIWYYTNINKHLLQIKDTCLFSVMSPWTETIDTFAILSRFH